MKTHTRLPDLDLRIANLEQQRKLSLISFITDPESSQNLLKHSAELEGLIKNCYKIKKELLQTH